MNNLVLALYRIKEKSKVSSIVFTPFSINKENC